MSCDWVAALAAFGEEADERRFPQISTGGFLVPGEGQAEYTSPGKEEMSNVRSATEGAAREEDGSRARPQARAPRSETTKTDQAPHTVSPVTTDVSRAHGMLCARGWDFETELGVVTEDYPTCEIVDGTPSFAYIEMCAGLFEGLPFHARFVLEVPLISRVRLSEPVIRILTREPERLFRPGAVTGVRLPLPLVPDVRAWGFWEGELGTSEGIQSHHSYPDGAICACTANEWIRGVHPLRDYVDFLVYWAALALHERTFARYPGRQHYGEFARRRRDRSDEYCGCGSDFQYRDCHRGSDQSIHVRDLWCSEFETDLGYRAEIAWQGREFRPAIANMSRVGYTQTVAR